MILTLVYNSGQRVNFSPWKNMAAGLPEGFTSIHVRGVRVIKDGDITIEAIRICDLLVGDEIFYLQHRMRVTSITNVVRFAYYNGCPDFKPSARSQAWVQLLK